MEDNISRIQLNEHVALEIKIPKQCDLVTYLGINSLVTKLGKYGTIDTPFKNEKQRKNGYFSEEQINAILEMRKEGIKNGDIAKKLGLDPKKVHQKIYNMKKRGGLV